MFPVRFPVSRSRCVPDVKADPRCSVNDYFHDDRERRYDKDCFHDNRERLPVPEQRRHAKFSVMMTFCAGRLRARP